MLQVISLFSKMFSPLAYFFATPTDFLSFSYKATTSTKNFVSDDVKSYDNSVVFSNTNLLLTNTLYPIGLPFSGASHWICLSLLLPTVIAVLWNL